jgi:hypothetical protein
MSDAAGGLGCRQCGRDIKGDGAACGLCKACRAAVVRRAGVWAVIPALLIAAGYFWMMDRFDLFRSNFLIIWFALGAALVWLAFKIARRVIYDVLHGRAVRRAAS